MKHRAVCPECDWIGEPKLLNAAARDAGEHRDETGHAAKVERAVVTDGGSVQDDGGLEQTAQIEFLYQQRMTVEIPVGEIPQTPEAAFNLVKNTDPEFVHDVIPNTWDQLVSTGALNVVDVTEAGNGE